MFLSNRVPPHVRRTYGRDATAGMLGAVMNGFSVPFFLMVARETYGASGLLIGIMSSAPVAGFLLSFVWAKWMAGKRKMPFAVGSWVVSRSMLLLAPFVRNVTDYVVLVCLFWVLASIAQPAYAALMKEIYPDSNRGRIMSYVRVLSFTIIALSGLVGGKLLDIDPIAFKVVFPVGSLFGVASALVFRSIPTKETTGDSSAPLSDFVVGSLKILVKDKGYRWFCGGIFVAGWAGFIVTPLYTVYQRDVLHCGNTWVGIYTLVTQGVSIVSYYYWSRFVDNKKPVYLVALCNLIWVGVPLDYYFATQPWMLVPSCVLLGLSFSGLDLAFFNGVLHYAPEDKVPQYQAVHLFLMGIRGLVGPIVGPMMVNLHWMSVAEMFLLSAGLTLASYLILIAGMRRHDGEDPNIRRAPGCDGQTRMAEERS